MNTSGMGHRDRFERIASSGCVFSEKPAVKGNSKYFQINGILFRLIEEEMELSFRSQNCLNHAGIRLIGQLVQKNETQLLNLNNFGRTSLREIINALSDMDLTLEMNLNFPPWNVDSNGAELIQILSLQKPGGGFNIDENAAGALGINLKQVTQKLFDVNPAHIVKNLPLLQTQYLLDRLEARFGKDMPYLTNIIKTHRKWLAKELR